MHFDTNFIKVANFMDTFGQEVNKVPTMPDRATRRLRYDLIAEELDELDDAMRKDDMVGIADALTDLLYVVYGAGHAYGINLDNCFRHIHASNMSKLDEDGKPIYREDGKVLKSDKYWPPELSHILWT